MLPEICQHVIRNWQHFCSLNAKEFKNVLREVEWINVTYILKSLYIIGIAVLSWVSNQYDFYSP